MVTFASDMNLGLVDFDERGWRGREQEAEGQVFRVFVITVHMTPFRDLSVD
jgi:hypothetical protein